MARGLTLAYPGDLNTLTGGYLYDKRILAELNALGWATHTLSLDDRFPNIDESTARNTALQLAYVDSAHALVVDGLALGALGQHAQTIKDRRPFVALVHHPLALEAGIDPLTARMLHQSEQVALSQAQHVIVTSQITRQTLIDQFTVRPEHISVIEPGVDRPNRSNPFNTRSLNRAETAIKLLSVGALVPRKGFDVLINALAELVELDWQLTIVGDDQRSPSCTQAIKALLKQYKLEARVHLVGSQTATQLAKYYEEADLFVLASRYEGYGMAYTEALAWGLPVIGTDGGAAVQTLATPAACLVPVEDTTMLAQTLRTLISDSSTRQSMREAAFEHAQQLPTWGDAGKQFSLALAQ